MINATGWPEAYTCAASFTFDVDSESLPLGVDRGLAARMTMMSGQQYGPLIGLPRILEVLRSCGVRGTFFVPGHTAERFPHQIEGILDGGHEIGHHGYLHEAVVGLPESQELDILDRGLEILNRRFGIKPLGYRAPHWEMNWRTPELLLSRGFLYDSSLMLGDGPFELSTSIGPLVELPINWVVDDFGFYCYLPEISGPGPLVAPSVLMQHWREDFEGVASVGGHWILTNHPFISGRPARAAALAGLIEHVQATDGVWIACMSEVAEHTRSRGLEPTSITQPTFGA